MKQVKTQVAIPAIKVLRNTHRGSKNDQWAELRVAGRDKPHRGQLSYIRKLVRKYGHTVDF